MSLFDIDFFLSNFSTLTQQPSFWFLYSLFISSYICINLYSSSVDQSLLFSQFQQSFCPNTTQSRMIEIPQNCSTKPSQYLLENLAKPKENFPLPQVNHPYLANGGYQSPPRSGEYQLVRLPKTQYDQCKQQPMANLKRLFTREVPCDQSETSGFVSQNYQRFTQDPVPLKKQRLSPMIGKQCHAKRPCSYQGIQDHICTYRIEVENLLSEIWKNRGNLLYCDLWIKARLSDSIVYEKNLKSILKFNSRFMYCYIMKCILWRDLSQSRPISWMQM